MYTLNVKDRFYNDVSIVETNGLNERTLSIDAVKNKLFNKDIFNISENNRIQIEHSPIRSMVSIPAVLVLEGNKMFGKYKNKKLY